MTVFCIECRDWVSPYIRHPKHKEMRPNKPGQNHALNEVGRAIKAGKLKDLKLEIVKCSDCEERATVYDHRDYNRPLMVDPVCRSCNSMRGPAITTSSFGRFPC